MRMNYSIHDGDGDIQRGSIETGLVDVVNFRTQQEEALANAEQRFYAEMRQQSDRDEHLRLERLMESNAAQELRLRSARRAMWAACVLSAMSFPLAVIGLMALLEAWR